MPTRPPLKQQQTPHAPSEEVERHIHTRTHRRTNGNSRGVAVLFSVIIMGVQSSDGQVMFSSIALLQQRFRELERIREKREERLLHVLAPRPAAAAAAAAAAPRETPVKWFFHPELLYPCRPLRETAAALFPAVPTTACECKSFQLHGDPIAMELWPSKTYNYKHVSGEVEVDTSLHL